MIGQTFMTSKNNATALLVGGFFLVLLIIVIVVLVWNNNKDTGGGSNDTSASPQALDAVPQKSGDFSLSSVCDALDESSTELQMGDEPVIEPPKGVQPGTLISPPYGEIPVPPLFDSSYGFKSNYGPSPFTNHMLHENMQAETTRNAKEQARNKIKGVIKKFDDFLGNVLYPNAIISARQDGTFIIKKDKNATTTNPFSNENKCVYLENYYDYVSASIATELGEAPDTTLNWAKGSGIGLRFSDMNKNIEALRVGLNVDCDDAAGYKVMEDGKVKSLSTDDLLKYEVKWPGDQTLLETHYATIE